MSGTDPTTPHPTESGAPVPRPPAPPAAVPPAQHPTPAVHVGGSAQAAPDDAPTSLMPALGAPASPATHERADATRVAAPLRPVPGDFDATRYLSPTANRAPSAAPVPTRTPSYSARRAPATPPAGPYGGLYADPLAVHVGTVPHPGVQDDAQATRVVGQTPAPPPPAAATRPPAPQPVAPSSARPLPAEPVAQPGSATISPSPVGYTQPAPAAPAAPPRAPAPRGATTARRRAEPRVVVLGSVVAVLVVVAFVLGFTLFGGSDSPAATPSAGASSSATTGAAQPVVTEHFAAPSRNITCTMTATEATCSIAQLNTKPAPVDGCDGTVGYVVKLGADGGVDTPCVAPKDQPAAASTKVTSLAYGKSVTLGTLTCSSSATGVECRVKGTGKGFSIARAGVRVL